MLSGIGPGEELNKFSIKQIAELPVGRNLQDHCLVSVCVRIHKPEGSMTMKATSLLDPLNLLEFYIKGTGQLTNNGMGIVGVMKTPSSTEDRPGED